MNCQDISRIADTGRISTLTDAERRAAAAHVLSCSRCAVVWSAHSQLLALDTPPMPAEVSLRFNALAGLPIRPQERYSPRRLTLIGGLVALAAAAGFLVWRMGGSPPLVPASSAAATALPPTDDAGATREVVPAASPVPGTLTASTTGSSDEAAMCAQTIKDVEAFAVMERNAAYPALAQEEEEAEEAAAGVDDAELVKQSDARMHAELGALQRRLAASRDPEVFLAAVLLYPPERRLADDPAAQTLLLELGLRAAASGSPLLAWHALRACVEAGQSCPYEDSVQSLFDANRQNAETWALVAMFKYRRGDVAGALTAMQAAARAPTSTWYWAESSALIERSLAAETAMPYPERMNSAFGSTAAALPPTTVNKMCKAESARSRAWAEACLAFGTLRTGRGDTQGARALGYAIREQALTALGDTEGAAEVAAEQALFRAEDIGGNLAPVGGLLIDLVLASPARMQAYIGAMQQYGEVAGVRMFLRQQLPSLLERAGLLEREGARECVAQLFAPRTAIGTRAATAAHRIQAADELLITVKNGSRATTVQVRPDGTFMMPHEFFIGTSGRTAAQLEREITAVGKTTAQLQQEIATLLTRRDQSPEVFVILISPRSREELRREFDSAR